MTTFLIVAAAFALLMILVTAVDCNRFVIREYTCISDKLGRDCLLYTSDAADD